MEVPMQGTAGHRRPYMHALEAVAATAQHLRKA